MKTQRLPKEHDLETCEGLRELGRASCPSCQMVFGWHYIASIRNDAIQCGQRVFENAMTCPFCGGKLAFKRTEVTA